MAVLKRADKRRYGNLYNSLKNSYKLRKNIYPETIPDVLRVLNNYRMECTPITTHPTTPPVKVPGSPGTGGRNSAVSSLQLSGHRVSFLRDTNNSFFPEIPCLLCEIKGLYQTHCQVAMNDIGAGIKSNRRGAGNRAGGRYAATGEEVRQ